jgi:hypothetical protein
MTLRLVIDKLEDVDEKHRELYKQGGDGKYHLDAESDSDSKKKIDEFRNNNVQLMKEKKDLEDKLAKLGDPEEINKMKKRIQEIDDKKMIEAGKLDELVEQKVARMKQDYETKIKAVSDAIDVKEAELKKTAGRLSEVLIDSEITKAVAGKVKVGAMPDLLARGRRVWSLDENGVPVPKEGDKILYGKDGKAHMTFDEWATVQMEVAPFLFEPSQGGGGGDGRGGNQRVGGKYTTEELQKIPAQERLRMIHGEGAKIPGGASK